MKHFILPTFVLFLSMLIPQSCTPKEKTLPKESNEHKALPQVQAEPGFVHTVYFWLKKDNPELLEDFLNEGLPQLAKVPSIQSVSWGPPAGTPRAVVDNSYDLAWIVNFANAEDQDEYQVDSLHQFFVKKYASIFEKVQVYDNIVAHYQVNQLR